MGNVFSYRHPSIIILLIFFLELFSASISTTKNKKGKGTKVKRKKKKEKKKRKENTKRNCIDSYSSPNKIFEPITSLSQAPSSVSSIEDVSQTTEHYATGCENEGVVTPKKALGAYTAESSNNSVHKSPPSSNDDENREDDTTTHSESCQVF